MIWGDDIGTWNISHNNRGMLGYETDTDKLYAAAKKLSTFLISRAAIVPVAAAALLPLVAAGATQLPIRELFKIARGLLLL